ncbi:replication factor A protein 3 [Gautieria morchelliformis]|nr:replication factor A protein 3 [Gautieria morchelliformis]
MADIQSPHTNSAQLPNYLGRTVRLWVKILKLQGDTAIVQASDGGEVKIKLSKTSNMSDPYVEVIGKVEEANVIMMLASTDLGSDFTDKDLENYNKVVEASETSRFRHLFQPQQ